MDYRSPIEICTHEPIFKEMEDGIIRATVSCGVQIDKDELIRALAYDREQYRCGYQAAERKYKRPKGEWQVRFPYDDTDKARTCSNCKITQSVNVYDGKVRFRFCPYCGAEMGGVKE